MKITRSMCAWKPLSLTLLVLISGSVSSHALLLTHALTWEQLVERADFVGTVECIRAGGIIARYKVIESLKGPAEGTNIMIRASVNYWGKQFPIFLCGERYFVMAFKERRPLYSDYFPGNIPLSWRRIPGVYRLDLSQGCIREPIAKWQDCAASLSSQHPDFASFKLAVKEFLALPDQEREMQMLKSLIFPHIYFEDRVEAVTNSSVANEGTPPGRERHKKEVSPDLLRFEEKNAKTLSELVELLVERQSTQILEQSGFETLKILQALPAKKWPGNPADRQKVIASLQSWLAPANSITEWADEALPVTPNSVELKQMRDALAGNPSSIDAYTAFRTLVIHEPETAANYLARWVNPQKDWWDKDRGYELASYFGWRCQRDREKNLRRLLNAKDPIIRVAGAVYLCYENESDGIAALRKLTKLKGDAGAWAALTLARRRQKDAVPRALDVLAVPELKADTKFFHKNLQSHLYVLLSNSAKSAGVPQPPAARFSSCDEAECRQRYNQVLAWWNAHQKKITPYDPWLPTLTLQKID